MSQFTTGEVASLCGVTVRTVQYYDTRGILTPSALSEGGRRLYNEDDLRRMKVICFLRDIGFSIDAIGKLLAEEDPGAVIELLLDQQEAVLRAEVNERREKLEKLTELRKGLRTAHDLSVETIGDVTTLMESKKKLKKMRLTLLFVGIPVSLLQVGSIILWIAAGIWWPFVVWCGLAVVYGVLGSRYYLRHTAYICPQCHTVFKPRAKQAFFAAHTPNTRKLTCPHCGHRGYCVETWGGDTTENTP